MSRWVVMAVMTASIAGGVSARAAAQTYELAAPARISPQPVREGPPAAAIRREAAGRFDLQRQAGGSPVALGWPSRHPILLGAIVGTAGGAVLSRFDAIGGQAHDPRVALIGTGVGAWGGLIASAVQKSRRNEKVPAGTKAAIAAGAVSLVVVPYLTCYASGGCR